MLKNLTAGLCVELMGLLPDGFLFMGEVSFFFSIRLQTLEGSYGRHDTNHLLTLLLLNWCLFFHILKRLFIEAPVEDFFISFENRVILDLALRNKRQKNTISQVLPAVTNDFLFHILHSLSIINRKSVEWWMGLLNRD